MKFRETTRLCQLLVLALLSAGIFGLDVWLPLGVTIEVLYVIPVLGTILMPGRGPTVILATTNTLLTLMGFLLSSEGGEFWMALVNDLLGVCAIWGVALLT